MNHLKTVIILLIVSATLTNKAHACTVIAAGKNATTDGSVLVSHTDAGPDSRIYVVPGKTFKPGIKAPVYFGIQDAENELLDDGDVIGHIPQVERTYTYFHSAYSHMNEYQLAIAESTTAQRDELKVTQETGKQIMTVEQAMIFALQRYKTAQEAVRFIGDLMTTYGFLPSSGDGSEALIVADPNEAWVFEVFGVGPGWDPTSKKPGAIWAAQRLPDDHATVIPNWSIIKQIDPRDTKRFMVSKNYLSEAVQRGYYDPNSGRPFVWQDAYTPLPVEYATGRFWLFYQTFTPNAAEWPDRFLNGDVYQTVNQYFQVVEPVSLYPFSAQPEKKISLRQIIEFQRSVFEGTIYDIIAHPKWLVPKKDEKGKFTGELVKSPLATPFPGSDLRELLHLTRRRPVARHRGHYGMVCQLRSWLPDDIGGVYWVYLDNPYFSPYVPIYAGNRSIARSYKTYNPDKYEERSARWAIDFVDNLARLRFQAVIKDVRKVRDPFEDGIFTRQDQMETDALALHQKDPQAARDFLTHYSNGLMNDVADMFIDLRNQIITNYTNNRE
jgi:dipeptidase